MMAKRERIDTVLAGKTPDRTPLLGGWIAAPCHIQSITGASEDEYWDNPFDVSVRAYEQLQMDALVGVFIPKTRGEYRCVDHNSFRSSEGELSIEDLVELIDKMPEPESYEHNFDFDAEYTEFKSALLRDQERVGEMVWMPAQWGMGACAVFAEEYGFDNYFYLIGLYQDRFKKLIEISAAKGRNRSRLLAKAVTEGIHPKAVFLGEDICTQRGPMVAPDLLEELLAPALTYGLAPLLEVGCKPIWHCDGNILPLIDMLIDCGVEGFQGFQPECGLTIEVMAEKKTKKGEGPVIFGPIAVTTELPVMTPTEIRARVRNAIDVCKDQAHLVLFTANTITPDSPLENIQAMYSEVLEG